MLLSEADDYHILIKSIIINVNAVIKFKVVLVGDSGTGKTMLMNRYVKGIIPKNT